MNGEASTVAPSRDVELARAAHKQGDAGLSRLAHQKLGASEAHTTESGGYTKSIIFGGLDGIITTFAVVAGVAGAGLDTSVVLVLGFANLFADGLSMGMGDYLSEKAETEYVRNEMRREEWEVENYIEGERKEMIELYVGKGMSEEDATLIIHTMSKYRRIFVDTMMVEELGLMPPDDSDNPAKQGFITFLSFCVFGVVPLLAYVFGYTNVHRDVLFAMSVVMSALTLLALGVVKAKLTSQNRVSTALWMLLNGGLAASASYFIGWAIEQIVNAN